MKIPLLFLLAITTPLMLAATLLTPLYASVLGAVYLIYAPASGPHPLIPHLFDVFYVSHSYATLLQYWIANMQSLSVVEYALPILGLPVLGAILSLWLTWKLGRKLLNVFYLSASAH